MKCPCELKRSALHVDDDDDGDDDIDADDDEYVTSAQHVHRC